MFIFQNGLLKVRDKGKAKVESVAAAEGMVGTGVSVIQRHEYLASICKMYLGPEHDEVTYISIYKQIQYTVSDRIIYICMYVLDSYRSFLCEIVTLMWRSALTINIIWF